MSAGASTGLATLRRDGFASMEAGMDEGILITRSVTFSGKYLFVNIDNPQGELRVELLDENENVIKPFSAEGCRVVRADSTRYRVTWNGEKDFASVAGRPVRFRFLLRAGKLYSFWVSPSASGASRGFVAAGGPGLAGAKDL
jgi:hypothetical protein